MAKKYFQRALSVGLSLALCVGMVAPGFAATFTDLQNAIDGATGKGTQFTRDEQIYYGYGDKLSQEGEQDKYAIEAKDGDGTRTVTLYEDVKFDKSKDQLKDTGEQYGEYGYTDGKAGIVIGTGDELSKNIALDLNGKVIDLNPEWTLNLESSIPQETCPGTLANREEMKVQPEGTIDPEAAVLYAPGAIKISASEMGYSEKLDHYGVNIGPVIKVEQEASLTVRDTSEKAEQGKAGKITGGVSDYGRKRGIGVWNQGSFVMEGGEISGNNDGNFGAVYNDGGSFTMDGGKITENRAGLISSMGDVRLNGGEIIRNISDHGNGLLKVWEEGPESIWETDGNSETVYPKGATIDENGNLVGESVTKTDNGDGTVTITDTKNGTHDVTVPEGGSVTLDRKGNTTITGGSSIEGEDGDGNKTVTTYPNGATIDKSGNVTGEGGITKTEKDDGSVEVNKGGDDSFTVNPPKGGDDGGDQKVIVKPDGSVDIPKGGTKDDGETETTYPDGGKITPDGTVEGEGTTVTKDKNTGDVTITDGEDNKTEIKVPEGTNPDDVKVDEKGNTTIPGGSEQPVEVKKDGEDGGTKITAPDGTEIVVNPDGSVDVPAGSTVTDKDGNKTELPNGGKVDKDGNVTGNPAITDKGDGTTDVTFTDEDGNETTVTVPTGKEDDVKVNGDGSIDVPAGSTVTDKDGNKTELPNGGKVNPDGTVTPNRPTRTPDYSGVTGGTDVVVIDGVEVPLAGLVSVEDVLSVLYRLAEGVEGERDEVVAWAVENGIIDEETDVEELVTVAALRSILANYARAFELDVDVTTLATLTGEDDDIVMNCDEVISEFFTKAEEDEAA